MFKRAIKWRHYNGKPGKRGKEEEQEQEAGAGGRRQELALPFAILCLLFRVPSRDFVDRSLSQSNERSTK